MTVTITLNNKPLTNSAATMLRRLVHLTFSKLTEAMRAKLACGLKKSVAFANEDLLRNQVHELLQALEGARQPRYLPEETTLVKVDNVQLCQQHTRTLDLIIHSAVENYAAGVFPEEAGLVEDLNEIAVAWVIDYRPFPRFPKLPHLQAEDLPGFEYRDMRQSDLSRIHMNPPPADNGWRREFFENRTPTGRMVRRKPQHP